MILEVDTDYASFCDPWTSKPDPVYRNAELVKILERVIEQLRDNHAENASEKIFDTNDNQVGYWSTGK